MFLAGSSEFRSVSARSFSAICRNFSAAVALPVLALEKPRTLVVESAQEFHQRDAARFGGSLILTHCGDTDDVDYIERLLDKGVYVGLDRYGLDMFLPIDKRNATVAELLRRGHAERMMISQDYCATIDWFPPEAAEALLSQGAIHNWSMTLVFDEVLPALREQGVLDDQTFSTIFVKNPRRWITA